VLSKEELQTNMQKLLLGESELINFGGSKASNGGPQHSIA
jgi:hypothetical protein